MSNKFLLIGILLSLPFFILNALVVSGAPVINNLRSPYIAGYEQVLILTLISLVFVGGIISLYPLLKTRRFIFLNTAIGIFLVGFSVMAGYGLGVDFYHCDILKIPNCD